MKVLVTGAAGFIGFHLCKALIEQGHKVVGIDNMNDYYDPKLKHDRLHILENMSIDSFYFENFTLGEGGSNLKMVMDWFHPEIVVNLAAQAGVRYSLANPQAYIDANVSGFLEVLEACVSKRPRLLLYASSSSVYGDGETPSSEYSQTSRPLSMYAATKKMNELMAHSYSSLYGIDTVGLRFFTVYGEYGRPDMALFKFVQNILSNQPLDLYNHGNHERSFTYVGDVVESMIALMNATAYEAALVTDIVNIGGDKAETLNRYVEVIEQELGMKAEINYMDMQAGDVHRTEADCFHLQDLIGYQPRTSIEEGIKRFVYWFRKYYGESL
jgi:UDP-glucuronate 4-epimerase